MKTKTMTALHKMKNLKEAYDMEEFYKTWHLLSWIFLIMGYAILLMNSLLFTGDPQALFGIGSFMLAVSIVNTLFMIINLIFLTVLIWKEEGWLYYREYFWISVFYIIVSLILWKASVMG